MPTGTLKSAVRSILNDRRFAAMVILTLAVCVAANTALFTIVNSVLLQPLPVPESDRILLMWNAYPKAGSTTTTFSSGADYYDRLRDVKVFEEQALFRDTAQTIVDHGSPERVDGMSATPSFFRMVRVPPMLGRWFTEDEGQIGTNQKVILSYGLWQRLFGGDRSAIGRELRLSGRPYTIVGVMPPGFAFADPDARFWTPIALTQSEKEGRHNNNWYNAGRLKPGATAAQAQAQIDALNAANLERFPQWKEVLRNAGYRTDVQPLKDLLVRDVKSTLYLLWGGAGFVLLIGAVNIANLVLARTNQRAKEFGTRLALGASHGQIAWQVITENVLISVTGGIAGLALASFVIDLLGKVGLNRFPRAGEVQAGWVAVLFAVTISALAGVVISLVPLAGIFRSSLTASLRESSRTGTSGRRSRWIRQSLVVSQIGLAFVLLAGAGLLLASFRNLLNTDPGFRTSGVLTASTYAPKPRYGDPELRSFVNRALVNLRQIPGVEAAGVTSDLPFSTNLSEGVVLAENHPMQPGESVISPVNMTVTPGYMEAIGMQLVRGRYFDEHDTETSTPVLIVDETLARRFWQDRDPIGQRMFTPNGPDLAKPDQHTRWLKVVGVVRSMRLSDLAGGGNAMGAYFYPYGQNAYRGFTFAVRTKVDPGSIANAARSVVASLDPDLALFDVKTMAERKELSLASRRTAMSLALAFGGLALFLSSMGIYSLLSYLLGQRRREIGVRMAVGSSPAQIFRLFLREGSILVGIGLACGFAGVVGLRKAVGNQVYGIQPLDPLILGLAGVLLGAIAIAACARPAQLAAKVDPIQVLNEQ